MDGLLLYRLDLEGFEFLIKHLAQVHDYRFVDCEA
jgi:hypothetical protein